MEYTSVDNLLRSLYYIDTENKALATRHGRRMMAQKSIFFEQMDKALWDLVKQHLLKDRTAPSEKILRSMARKAMASEVLERMDLLQKVPICTEDEFRHFLDEVLSDIKKRECSLVFSTAGQILAGTYKPKKKEQEKAGPQDAIRFVLERGMDFLYEDTRGEKLRGDIRKDGDDMVQEYERAEAVREESVGILTGLDQVDLQTQGIKRGDLWLVGGYTSDGKTTLCLNIAHKAVCNGYNVMYASMEMSRKQIRQILYCIHSGHKHFSNIHGPLSLNDIRNGELDEDAKAFYLNHVIPDFQKNPRYGCLEVIQPQTLWTAETVRAEAEILHETLPGGLDLIVPDYVGLMGVDGKSEGRNEDLNVILRGLKNMALTFGGGDQVSILTPFQCNREGRKRAEGLDQKKSSDGSPEEKGIYDLQALSSAHEAERSSDVVLSIFTDPELKSSQQAVICQLKGRDTGCASPHIVHANLDSRIIRENPPCSIALEDSVWLDNLVLGL